MPFDFLWKQPSRSLRDERLTKVIGVKHFKKKIQKRQNHISWQRWAAPALGQIQPATCEWLLCILWTENGFAFWNDWKNKIKRWIIFCDTWKSYKIQISVTINKVLLEYSRAYLFTACGRFHTSVAESSPCRTDRMATNPAVFTICLLQKSFLVPSFYSIPLGKNQGYYEGITLTRESTNFLLTKFKIQ